jgi:hypothetical protein
MKSHNPESCLVVLVAKEIDEGHWLELRRWYLSDNEHENIRAKNS